MIRQLIKWQNFKICGFLCCLTVTAFSISCGKGSKFKAGDCVTYINMAKIDPEMASSERGKEGLYRIVVVGDNHYKTCWILNGDTTMDVQSMSSFDALMETAQCPTELSLPRCLTGNDDDKME